MVREFKPPQRTSVSFQKSVKIFLAGTIDMGVSEEWQNYVVKSIASRVRSDLNVDLYNPRRVSWDNSLEQSFENPQFNQQVAWEMSNLDKADIIIINFLPDSKSPVSMLELGLYASSEKVLVSCPEDFYRSGNISMVCEKYNIPLYDNIDQLIDDLMTKINKFI
jgi:hypothetical protein